MLFFFQPARIGPAQRSARGMIPVLIPQIAIENALIRSKAILAVMRMTQPETDTGFAEGIRLFNRGNFFAAHEVWEQGWKTSKGTKRIFYKGIIQAAVALLHFQRGNYAGAVSVYLKSSANLAPFPSLWMGIELGQFRSELRQYFTPLQNSFSTSDRNCQSVEARQIAGTARLPIIRWAPA